MSLPVKAVDRGWKLWSIALIDFPALGCLPTTRRMAAQQSPPSAPVGANSKEASSRSSSSSSSTLELLVALALFKLKPTDQSLTEFHATVLSQGGTVAGCPVQLDPQSINQTSVTVVSADELLQTALQDIRLKAAARELEEQVAALETQLKESEAEKPNRKRRKPVSKQQAPSVRLQKILDEPRIDALFNTARCEDVKRSARFVEQVRLVLESFPLIEADVCVPNAVVMSVSRVFDHLLNELSRLLDSNIPSERAEETVQRVQETAILYISSLWDLNSTKADYRERLAAAWVDFFGKVLLRLPCLLASAGKAIIACSTIEAAESALRLQFQLKALPAQLALLLPQWTHLYTGVLLEGLIEILNGTSSRETELEKICDEECAFFIGEILHILPQAECTVAPDSQLKTERAASNLLRLVVGKENICTRELQVFLIEMCIKRCFGDRYDCKKT
ncbi:hypothetical protein DFJ73DRAFT_958626 [Zopfochytrium polystomum]|nr:hypothetical protein DFJ73DRAFT_958626 [Zopfochytrium polystomum]